MNIPSSIPDEPIPTSPPVRATRVIRSAPAPPDPASATAPPPVRSTLPASVAHSLAKMAGGSSNGVSRCIYFRSQSHLDVLDALREHYPRASVSAVVQQLVEGFISSLQAQPEGARSIPVQIVVYL